MRSWATATLFRSRVGRNDEVDAAIARAPRSPAAQWLFWLTRMRVAIQRSEDEMKMVAEELAATPFGQLPPLSALVKLPSRTLTTAEAVASVGPLVNAEESAARPRALGRLIVCEVAAFLGDEPGLEDAIGVLDTTSLVDLTWFDLCAPLEPYRARPWFVAVRDSVARRAEALDEVLRQLGVRGESRDSR